MHRCAGCHSLLISRTVDIRSSKLTFLGCSSSPDDCDQSIVNSLPPVDVIVTYFTPAAASRLLALVEVETIIETVEVTD